MRGRSVATGYLHPLYAASLADGASPLHLPRSGGWIIRRAIPGAPYTDAMGAYPILACTDWEGLADDLRELEGELVSVAGVADPFGGQTEQGLRAAFPDLVKPFKEHFVVDLTEPLRESVSQHHRRNVAKGLGSVEVELLDDPDAFLDDWTDLYSTLVVRHGIRGVAAFSRAAFASQLAVPGLVAFRAVRAGETVGMLLWYVMRDVAYYHLGAYSPAGYESRASFALFWTALQHFAGTASRWASLGSGPGVVGSQIDGLTRFKSGWASSTRTAYFCGRVLDEKAYEHIVRKRRTVQTDYFPAYRAGDPTIADRPLEPLRIEPPALAASI